MVQRLGARVPNAGRPGSVPGRGLTRSCMLQLRPGAAKQVISNYLKHFLK